jgi:hypothetical protein
MAKEQLTEAEQRVKDAGFQRVKSAKEEEGAKQRILNIESELVELGKKHFKQVNDILGVQQDLAKIAKFRKEIEDGTQEGTKEQAQDLLKSLETDVKRREAIMDSAGGVLRMAGGIKAGYQNLKLMAGSAMGIFGIVVAIGAAFLKFAKEVADTRKELGVSVVQATEVAVQTRALGIAAKGFGLELQDIKDAQSAIRQDLGASVQESINLSLNFARTAAATGQSASDLTKTLSIMESISSSSREVLLNQIKTNAAMIEAAGVAPALVMKDIAENAEFFAQFAKDGGQNLVQAGIAARKLGLDMSAVSSITNSLLEFETSIEKSMEASVLLGRQINTDRARQLALVGDQAGLMKEIQRIVGGEAEFSMMNAIQRRALAESVGLNVEQLARAVRGNTVGATGAAAGGAMGDVQSKQLGALHNIADGVNTVADNTRQSKSY